MWIQTNLSVKSDWKLLPKDEAGGIGSETRMAGDGKQFSQDIGRAWGDQEPFIKCPIYTI